MPLTEKTVSTTEAMADLQDHCPTIPDSITASICAEVGFETSDPRIIRVISIATQQFMANVTNGAMQRCKGRFATLTSKSGEVPKNGKYTLTMEDLTPALFDYGITIRKPPYFV